MNADWLIKTAQDAAERMTGETSGAFYWSAMAGALEAHIRALSAKLVEFEAPMAGSLMETMYAHDGGEFVVQYEMEGPDEEVGYSGSLVVCGVYANGMNVLEALSDDEKGLIEEHCGLAADAALRDAEYDEAEHRYQSRKDDEVMA